MTSKFLSRTKIFVKESIPILLPTIIIFTTYDLLSWLNWNVKSQEEFYADSLVSKYSILSNGFIPVLSILGLDPNLTTSKIINNVLLSMYILFTVAGFGYSLLFHFFCISASYEKKWSGISAFIYNIFNDK